MNTPIYHETVAALAKQARRSVAPLWQVMALTGAILAGGLLLAVAVWGR